MSGNKVKYFGALIICLAAFFLLRDCFGEKRKKETLKDLLSPKSADARALSESFERVLPKLESRDAFPNPENVVVIRHESQKLDLSDVKDRVENLSNRPDHEALDFLQWFIRSESYSEDEKIEVLKEVAMVLPKNDLKLLVSGILIHYPSQILQREALRTIQFVLPVSELEEFVRVLSRDLRTDDSKETLRDFGAEAGLEIN